MKNLLTMELIGIREAAARLGIDHRLASFAVWAFEIPNRWIGRKCVLDADGFETLKGKIEEFKDRKGRHPAA